MQNVLLFSSAVGICNDDAILFLLYNKYVQLIKLPQLYFYLPCARQTAGNG